jgi:hypothetical protein
MKSLAMKLNELSQIGIFKQHTLEERLKEYATWPEEERRIAEDEARSYASKGLTCNEFSLTDGSVESVIQWQKPDVFIKNCYQWFIVNA